MNLKIENNSAIIFIIFLSIIYIIADGEVIAPPPFWYFINNCKISSSNYINNECKECEENRILSDN